jgi:oligopeptide/dipeptide ABC transporter ATP-binding protein
MNTTPAALLEVQGLFKSFQSRRSPAEIARREPPRRLTALDDVSLELEARETLGIVGESGSGKSTLAHCLVRLVTPERGHITLCGTDLLGVRGRELRSLRRQIQLIYQDPYSSLNPRLTIGTAVGEPARVHGLVDRHAEAQYVEGLLSQVGLAAGDARKKPSQLSGGQRQRAAIARALAVQPTVLVADEPVSALDVSIQAQILNLFATLTAELGVGLIVISHDLAVVSHIARRVAVMYLGRIVEIGPTEDIFLQPCHPYTRALIAAHPRMDRLRSEKPALSGEIPSALNPPSGCRFRTRCPLAKGICSTVDPQAVEVAPGHWSRCHILAPAP